MQAFFHTYLEHFLNAIGLDGGVLVNVGTKYLVGIWVFLSFFSAIVAQLVEDGLRHIGVQIIYEYSLRHYFIYF
jgi:hypothetical protein